MHFLAINRPINPGLPMVALEEAAKLSTSPKVTIFPPPLPYHFISD